MSILQMGDFNAPAPNESVEMKGITGITGLLGEVDDTVTSNNSTAWSHSFDDTPGGYSVKYDYIMFGRALLGNILPGPPGLR